MSAVYYDWPDKETFDYHVTNFQPFHAVRICLTQYPTAENLASISDNVNICCNEGAQGNVFHGDVVRQEHISMTLSSFVEGFLALENKRSHWIHEIDFQLYLSQATLYSTDTIKNPVQIISLSREVEIPLPLLRSGCFVNQINLWMNISAVRSCLHYDQYDNILILLRGCKTVTLISPSHTNSTRPVYLITGGGANHSMFSSAEELIVAGSLSPHHVQTYILNTGDAIFIPEGWWHDVVSDECSLALNFWFESPLHHVINEPTNSKSGSPCVSACPGHMTSYMLRSLLQKLISNDMKSSLDSYRITALIACRNLDAMDFAQFESFMFQLHNHSASVILETRDDDISNHSGPLTVDYSSSDQKRKLCEKNSMEDSLVTSSHTSMTRLWPTFAEKNPLIWGRILSQLRPISAQMLINSWESFKPESSHTNAGEKNSAVDFFSMIFDPLQEQAVEVSKSIYEHINNYYTQSDARITFSILRSDAS